MDAAQVMERWLQSEMLHSLISASSEQSTKPDPATLGKATNSLASVASALTTELLCIAQGGITLVANVVDENGYQVVMEALDAVLFPDPQRRTADNKGALIVSSQVSFL
jgi:hypothetical protein